MQNTWGITAFVLPEHPLSSISLRWRPLPQEVGEGERLDGGPEHRRVEVEHLDDPGVLLGVVGGQQLGRHLQAEFTTNLNLSL